MILVLKHKWYDMIASGEKKEEYRRMPQGSGWLSQYAKFVADFEAGLDDMLIFRRGYTMRELRVSIRGVTRQRYAPEYHCLTTNYSHFNCENVGGITLNSKRKKEWGYDGDDKVNIIFHIDKVLYEGDAII